MILGGRAGKAKEPPWGQIGNRHRGDEESYGKTTCYQAERDGLWLLSEEGDLKLSVTNKPSEVPGVE